MTALKSASKILVEYFSNITVEREIEEAPVIVQLETDEILKKPIEEVIPLSVRTGNVFKKAGIYTIQDLFSKSRKDLLSLKNFGMKSLSSTLEELLKVPDIEHLLSRDDLRLITEIKAGEISASSEDFDESDEDTLERTPSKKMSDSDDEMPVDEQPQDKVKDTILNMSIVDMCLELAISDSQLERLKKLQIDIVEHLTHLNKEDLLIGNNKLSKKNVDKIEEFLHQHGLKLKE
jgi:DNA-directed RNA polymerase alpha subunit